MPTDAKHLPGAGIFSDLKLLDYLDIARRRKWWIILSSVAVFLVATMIALRLKNIYEAETTILVDSSQIPYNYVAPVVTTDISARLSTLQQQVLSPTRLKTLVESSGLYPGGAGKRTEDEVIQSVQKAITVQVVNPGGKMGAFRIAYNSTRRDEVAGITNRIAQMFIDENLKAREEQTSGTAQFLEDRLADTKRQLDATDEQLRAIKSQNIDDLPESKPYHMEALATLRGQLQAIEDKINQDQRDKAMLQSMLLSGGPAPTIDVQADYSGGNPGLSPNEAQLQKLEAKLSELRTRYGPAHPEVRRTQGEIDQLKKKIVSSSTDSSAASVNQKPAIPSAKTSTRNPVLEAQVEQLDEEIKNLSSQTPPIQKQIDFHTAKLAEIPVFEQRISRLQQDNESLKKEYAGLLEKKQAAEMSYALEIRQKAEKFVPLDLAQTPEKPVAPNRPMISLAGLLGGLILGASLAAAAEMNDETVRSESEAARLMGKPVLGGIPYLVSTHERRAVWRRAVGMVTCTVVGSLALGFLLSLIAGRFL